MRKSIVSILSAGFFALASFAANAQSIRLITDSETKALIRDFSAPLMRAAGIQNKNLPIYIVNDRRFNAFVVESGAMFVNYGTILDAQTPNALKAVLAHEIGHLAGGHLQRLKDQADVAGKLQAISTVLGIGVLAAAGGRDESGDIGRLVSAFVIGSASASNNAFMSYRRSEESAADAAALTYLERTKQSPMGLVDVLNILQKNQSVRAGASPYLRTHPMAEDRLNQAQNRASGSPFRNKPDRKSDIARLDLVQAKLSGYLERSASVLNRFPNSDKSQAARYARTIAGYRAGAGAGAIKQMSALAKTAPNNPYFQEILGQMYYETGKPSAAIKPLARAVKINPNEHEFRMLYALALTDTGTTKNIEEGIRQLRRASVLAPKSARPHSILARAYAKLGDEGQADLAAAEAALLREDIPLARGLARKAQKKLVEGTPAWLRSDDILSLT